MADSNNLLSSSTAVNTIPLRNGIHLPVLSLGTSHVKLAEDKEKLPRFIGFVPELGYRQIELALQNGIRSFETGRIYRTHRQIGHVLGEWFRLGQLQDRSEIFLTTKVYHGEATRVGTKNTHMYNMETLSPENVTTQVTKEIEDALVDLGLGYIDLTLLHWPASAKLGKNDNNHDGNGNDKDDTKNEICDLNNFTNRQRRIAAWKVLEEYYEKGWLRAIGVSNFSEDHLEQLREDGATIIPMVNQIEASLSVHYPKIVQYCEKNGIVCQAFSPFKRGAFVGDDDSSSTILEPLMKKYNKNVAQITLRYLIQNGYAVVFLSTNEQRMKTNYDIFDFELDKDEIKQLGTLPREDGNWGLPTPYDLE